MENHVLPPTEAVGYLAELIDAVRRRDYARAAAAQAALKDRGVIVRRPAKPKAVKP